MSVLENRRSGVRAPALVSAIALSVLAATAAVAAPLEPTPVKDDPNVNETSPAAHGGWFGWAQSRSNDAEKFDFYVQHGDDARIRVNAANTQGLGGDVTGHSAFYLQQLHGNAPRIHRYDLKTKQRSALPTSIAGGKRSSIRGSLTASGPWLLVQGSTPQRNDYPLHTVILYNRVTHERREIDHANYDYADTLVGQVNGRYVTYAWFSYGDYTSSVERYDIKTKRTVELVSYEDGLARTGTSVSSDGTVYYFENDPQCGSPDPCVFDLVRSPIAGSPTVIASMTRESWMLQPGRTHVKDRSDGSHVVYVSWSGDDGDSDIDKLVDDGS
ncbi:hypothetical protein [Nocardioides mangrovi]|uniref:WD40 repeat domain-containing protein n=1 Tax=Nocardioides mangrovi TaxID=2874580 RepID=A0ABS7UDG8_9ACTN|nr:hypothetical protein [Nocardioides mangrovi]MBZ5739039.1 hypothetical protein [Nocardioides mangrovi]